MIWTVLDVFFSAGSKTNWDRMSLVLGPLEVTLLSIKTAPIDPLSPVTMMSFSKSCSLIFAGIDAFSRSMNTGPLIFIITPIPLSAAKAGWEKPIKNKARMTINILRAPPMDFLPPGQPSAGQRRRVIGCPDWFYSTRIRLLRKSIGEYILECQDNFVTICLTTKSFWK